jgi:hypothetical protein
MAERHLTAMSRDTSVARFQRWKACVQSAVLRVHSANAFHASLSSFAASRYSAINPEGCDCMHAVSRAIAGSAVGDSRRATFGECLLVP